MNLKDINAFALPGGPMFVQRGMFDAAAEEAEVAGVMAHELSRVLLRHGTANASKAQNPWLQLGQIAGAVVGGELGGYIAEGTRFGLGTLLLRYSRDYEKQADLLGAQIMARAGYDPRARAHAPSRSASIRLNKTATWFQMALFWSTNFFNRISYLYAGSFIVSAISPPVGSSSDRATESRSPQRRHPSRL